MSFIKEEVLDVCRICETIENLLDTSTEEFKELNEKLHKIGEFEDKYNYWLKYICTTCSINLQNAFAFKTKCEFTYKKLVDQIEDIKQNQPIYKPMIIFCEQIHSNDLDHNKHIKQEEEDQSSLATKLPEDFDESLTSQCDTTTTSTKSKASNNKKSLKRKNVGLKNKSSRKTNLLFVCEHCEKILRTKKGLREHMKNIHLKNKPCTCETCGAKLKHNAGLLKHRKMHSGQKFSCDTCGKTFAMKQYLEKHRKAHFEKRKPKAFVYLCHFCGQGAADLHHYEEHLRIHSGERLFKCDKCDKSFAQMQGLKIHSLTHSDERPYACQLCTSTFRKKSHLNGHMVSHTGERKYKCKICEKSYTTSAGLKNHMRLHTGEQPFECSNCQMKFRLRKMLVSHKKKSKKCQ